MCINQYGQPTGAELPDWQPVPELVRGTLHGRFSHLVPLALDHSEALFAAYSLAGDDRDWTWLGSMMPRTLSEMSAWITDKIQDKSLVPYAVIDEKTATAVGVVCFAENDTEHGLTEIGHVTWSPLMQRTAIGTEAVFLMLQYAFSLGYRRVAWRCDSLNQASRRAAERLGFTYEGRFRQAMVRKQRNRDTEWLSIIDAEWPAVDKALTAWLAEENFTDAGEQKVKLETLLKRVRTPL
ncbi:GNAT family protein [Erwinia pyri]|uniref:GNAT family protein n=1 Tax=Erwinia pyri TaxID=3062598 RepID=A0AA50HSK5_9GAMM|nr:GNAT family protein [Erwinia sp. DE2]WLS80798.1 GNAT family protein [Erwinia sp. DE2]